MKKERGFSLPQLMVAIAIVGFVATFLVTGLVKTSKEVAGAVEAKLHLKDLRVFEEAYRMEYEVYTASLTNVDYAQPVGDVMHTYRPLLAKDDDCLMVAVAKQKKGAVWMMKIKKCVAESPCLFSENGELP